MLTHDQFTQCQWIAAVNEYSNENARGSFAYQKPSSLQVADLHERVSGLHLGLRSVRIPRQIDFLKSLDVNLWHINQNNYTIDLDWFPKNNINYSEFAIIPQSSTVHTALEFINQNKGKTPVCFDQEFWYTQNIIMNFKNHKIMDISHYEQLSKDCCLIMSVPYFGSLDYMPITNNILEHCNKLNIPVMLDFCWMPLNSTRFEFENIECVQVISQTFSKSIPYESISSGIAFWRNPINYNQKTYELGSRLATYILYHYQKEFDYYFTVNHLTNKQTVFCDILGLSKHTCVLTGLIPQEHYLENYHLHSHRIDNASNKMLSLVSWYENEQQILNFIKET